MKPSFVAPPPGHIILWDVATGQPKGHTNYVYSVAFTPDGRTLASGSLDNTIILWDVTTGQPKGAPRKVASAVTALSFTDDCLYLLVHTQSLRSVITKRSVPTGTATCLAASCVLDSTRTSRWCRRRQDSRPCGAHRCSTWSS